MTRAAAICRRVECLPPHAPEPSTTERDRIGLAIDRVCSQAGSRSRVTAAQFAGGQVNLRSVPHHNRPRKAAATLPLWEVVNEPWTDTQAWLERR
jgi:hypothetical protein